MKQLTNWIKLPSQAEADYHKAGIFQEMWISECNWVHYGTHVRIQAPVVNEHEYVNQKNHHSINIQVLSLLQFYNCNIIR